MLSKEKKLTAAKKAVKENIKFLKELLKKIESEDSIYHNLALCTLWCLSRYIGERLMSDTKQIFMEEAAEKND